MKKDSPNIYKITDSTNGKIYIGQSCYLDDNYLGSGNLIKEAVKIKGKKNFSKEYLTFCDSKDLNRLETKYIKENNSCDSNIGYNLYLGGSNIPKGKDNTLSKEVFVYDFNGDFLYSFVGVRDKARELNILPSNLLRALDGRRVHYKENILSYNKLLKKDVLEKVEKYKEYNKNLIDKRKNKTKIFIKNIETGEETSGFCITGISENLGVERSSIRRCLRGERVSGRGFMFSYSKDWDIQNFKISRETKTHKEYEAVNKDGVVFEFCNMTQFCKKHNLKRRKVNSIILKEYKGTKIDGWRDFREKKEEN